MVARERNSNENNAHFIHRLTFFYTESEPEYQEIFLKVLKKMFLSFERRSVIVFSNFFKQILSKMVQKQALIVGNNCPYQYSDKYLLHTCIYTDEEQLSAHFD